MKLLVILAELKPMKKIIIVEDDKTIAEELLFLLNNSDYEGIILKDFENSKKEIEDMLSERAKEIGYPVK